MTHFGIDIDNTAAQYHVGLANFAASIGEPLPDHFPTEYDYAKSGHFHSREAFLDMHSRAVHAGLFATLEPMDGFLDAVERIRDRGDTISFVTHRLLTQHPDVERRTTYEWLETHGLSNHQVVFTGDKHHVDVSPLIDDAPGPIGNANKHGQECIIFSQPYNLHLPGQRISHWREVYPSALHP